MWTKVAKSAFKERNNSRRLSHWTARDVFVENLRMLGNIYIYMSCSIVTVSILLTLAPRHYPVRFGFRIVEIFESLVENKSGQPAVVSGPVSMEDLFRSFQGLDWGKIWPEAEVGRVCKYMFGSKDLDIPPEFKAMVPRTI